MNEQLRRFGTELLATFCVCLIAILAAAGTAAGDAGRIVTALAYGLAVMAALQLFGPAAAVHLNPAVTLAIFTTGRVHLSRLLSAVVGQLLGGCLAGLVASWLLDGAGTALGMPVGAFTKTDVVKTAVIEGFLALMWAGVHLSLSGGRSAAAPLVVGLAVVGLAVAGLPFTGAAMNPARAVAAAVAAGDFRTLWLYAAAPLSGGAVAGLIGRWLLAEQEPAQG